MLMMNVRCAALDTDGKQCTRPGTRLRYYFGEEELYRNGPSWVNVWFCDGHDPHREESANDV